MMTLGVSTVLFLLGLAVGSLVNVIALRYRLSEKLLTASVVSGRSACMTCRKQLRWYELIPLVSFVIQLGRCRSCSARLSLQYPLIELVTGLIFLLVPGRLQAIYHIWNVSTAPELLWLLVSLTVLWLIAYVLLLLVFLIDLRTFIIPDRVNLSLALVGVIIVLFRQSFNVFGLVEGSFLGHHALLFGFREHIWANHLMGALIGVAVFGLIAVLSRGRAMGWGDVKLVGALGLLFGWPDVILIMFLSFVIGSLGSLFLLATKRKTLKDIIPFGPYIVISATLVFFWGVELMDGYFALFDLF